MTAYDRFHTKFEIQPDGCWMWTGAISTNGYGSFSANEDGINTCVAHRWSYRHYVGEIPEGLQLDHLCRNRACVNPEHLEPVTNGENGRRRYEYWRNAGPVMCWAGVHELTGEHVYVDSRGLTRCRTCNNERNAARGRARRAAATALRLAAK